MVTGGAGFIGAHLCRTLAARGDRVTAYDDLTGGFAVSLSGSGVSLVAGSTADRELLGETVALADTIVHLASLPSVPRSAEDPAAAHEVNVTGTLNVLEAARHCGAHVVLVGSAAVYGEQDAPSHEDLPARPLSPYGASELAAEAYALAYGHSFGVPVLPLRVFNVYGPLQTVGRAHSAIVPAFIDAALRGLPLQVHGDGRQVRDLTHVSTVVAAIRDAIDRQVTSHVPVNLALGAACTPLRLVSLLESLLDRRLEVVHTQPRRGDQRVCLADPARFRALFPALAPVPLEQGLSDTLAWFRSEESIPV
ncbi:NAD-dependent epimerase/dehydratase family protein [Actinocorallia populi]|uniref:NAD-dependent epimerase/dehydratase family protein n=1 Tax=Actinocorallia populi TaxID=2079200 RepID=UPI001E4256E7|nr:NAD-dependent epimerase/dehydratase family protein [Actinocorallia populi]